MNEETLHMLHVLYDEMSTLSAIVKSKGLNQADQDTMADLCRVVEAIVQTYEGGTDVKDIDIKGLL